jgi:hypothetical protein
MSIPFNFGDNPGQVCQIVSQDTYATNNVALSGLGGGGGEYDPTPVFSSVITSSILVSSVVATYIRLVPNSDLANHINLGTAGAGDLAGGLTLHGNRSTILSVDSLAYDFQVATANAGSIGLSASGVFSTNGIQITTLANMTLNNVARVSSISFAPTGGAISSISSINGVNWARLSTLAGGP